VLLCSYVFLIDIKIYIGFLIYIYCNIEIRLQYSNRLVGKPVYITRFLDTEIVMIMAVGIPAFENN